MTFKQRARTLWLRINRTPCIHVQSLTMFHHKHWCENEGRVLGSHFELVRVKHEIKSSFRRGFGLKTIQCRAGHTGYPIYQVRDQQDTLYLSATATSSRKWYAIAAWTLRMIMSLYHIIFKVFETTSPLFEIVASNSNLVEESTAIVTVGHGTSFYPAWRSLLYFSSLCEKSFSGNQFYFCTCIKLAVLSRSTWPSIKPVLNKWPLLTSLAVR